MEKKLYFFLPIEITNRELDYKINIARYFSSFGFDVILGNPPYLRDELKYKNYQGIFLEKGVNPTPEYYRFLKEKGVYLYDLSDEGLGKCVYNITYQPVLDALAHMRKIFFWGEAQSSEIANKCEQNDVKKAMQAIGNPSFDLSFPNYKCIYKYLNFHSLLSDYILVNMNFPALFGYSKDENIEACPNMAPQTKALISDELYLENLQWPVFQEWLEKIIQDFPNEYFLIRPHPAEIQKNYEKIFGKYKNVLISKEGNVNYVIASAKLILHKDCSTAMQGYFMGVPSISLGGELLYKDYAQWPLNFSVLPKKIEDAKEVIAQLLKTDKLNDNLEHEINERAKKALGQFFCNLGNSTKVLVDIIINDAKDLINNTTPYKLIDSRSLFQKAKLFIRKNMPLHYKVPKASREIMVEFTKKDIIKRLDLLESVDPLGSKLFVRKVFPNVFKISRR